MQIPEIRKKITSFLLSEEGKISKQSLLSLGSFLSAVVIGGVLATKQAAAQHTNVLDVGYSGGVATGTHSHYLPPPGPCSGGPCGQAPGDSGDAGDGTACACACACACG